MKFDDVRKAALALPETTEEPHHHFTSFRVKGKIFITAPPEQEHVHLFVSETEREVALATCTGFTEKLLWGGKVVGIKLTLAKANAAAVKALVSQAYKFKSLTLASKASKKLATPVHRRHDAA